jgi:hypothetical protein
MCSVCVEEFFTLPWITYMLQHLVPIAFKLQMFALEICAVVCVCCGIFTGCLVDMCALQTEAARTSSN